MAKRELSETIRAVNEEDEAGSNPSEESSEENEESKPSMANLLSTRRPSIVSAVPPQFLENFQENVETDQEEKDQEEKEQEEKEQSEYSFFLISFHIFFI